MQTKIQENKSVKYDRIWNRYNECRKLVKETNDIKYDMEMHCIEHQFDPESISKYENIVSFCQENGIERVFDIGCAMGHQSECFIDSGVNYVGVDDRESDFWNRDRYQYIVSHYPCELQTQKGDLAVSVLCLTWNCYLYDGDKTLREQCEALNRDFDHCLLYITADKVKAVAEFFPKYQSIDEIRDSIGCFYYFSK